MLFATPRNEETPLINCDIINIYFVASASIPRYIRINRIKTSVEEVIKHFEQNDYQQVLLEEVEAYIQKVNTFFGVICKQ